MAEIAKHDTGVDAAVAFVRTVRRARDEVTG
jgi:hypothetical protein